MSKKEVLLELRRLYLASEVTEKEVIDTLHAAPDTEIQSKEFFSKNNFHGLLYFVGGGIVFLGLSVLLGQNWDVIGSLGRILATLGGFVACYLAGLVLSRQEKLLQAAYAFFTIGYLLLPIGISVTLYEGGVHILTSGILVFLAACTTVVTLASLLLFKHRVHLFFGFVSATALLFTVIAWIHTLFAVPFNWQRDMYVFGSVGLAYLSFGYYFLTNGRRTMAAFAHFFGLFAVMISTLVLGRWQPEANIVWEILYPLIAFAVVFASLPLKSKLYFVFGLLGIVAYISKITAEYFSGSLGWPLSIVFAGLLIMISGYGVFSLRKKYQN